MNHLLVSTVCNSAPPVYAPNIVQKLRIRTSIRNTTVMKNVELGKKIKIRHEKLAAMTLNFFNFNGIYAYLVANNVIHEP